MGFSPEHFLLSLVTLLVSHYTAKRDPWLCLNLLSEWFSEWIIWPLHYARVAKQTQNFPQLCHKQILCWWVTPTHKLWGKDPLCLYTLCNYLNFMGDAELSSQDFYLIWKLTLCMTDCGELRDFRFGILSCLKKLCKKRIIAES